LGKEKDEKEKLNANNGEKEHDPDSFAALTSKLRQGKDSESLASEPRGNSDTVPQSSSSLPFEESLGKVPRAARILTDEGLMEKAEDQGTTPKDLTLGALSFPAGRDLRLQSLARADEGFVLSLAYSSQRGFGSTHPFVTDLRLGKVKVEFIPPELGFPVTLGEIELTECETVNQFVGNEENPPVFTRGYGLVFGFNERKAISMAIVERSLRSDLKEAEKGPAQNEEFVLAHGDNVEAAGFVSHVKLPHYVDFQAELGLVRDMRKKHDSFRKEREEAREETRKEAREEAPLGAPPREIRTP
jgi:alpha-D-ribose 1-methylphosphonate 5-triphosphate synthase subunit PhnI